MDYTVHGVAKSRTQLSDFHFHWPLPSRSQVVMAKKMSPDIYKYPRKGEGGIYYSFSIRQGTAPGKE